MLHKISINSTTKKLNNNQFYKKLFPAKEFLQILGYHQFYSIFNQLKNKDLTSNQLTTNFKSQNIISLPKNLKQNKFIKFSKEEFIKFFQHFKIDPKILEQILQSGQLIFEIKELGLIKVRSKQLSDGPLIEFNLENVKGYLWLKKRLESLGIDLKNSKFRITVSELPNDKLNAKVQENKKFNLIEEKPSEISTKPTHSNNSEFNTSNPPQIKGENLTNIVKTKFHTDQSFNRHEGLSGGGQDFLFSHEHATNSGQTSLTQQTSPIDYQELIQKFTELKSQLNQNVKSLEVQVVLNQWGKVVVDATRKIDNFLIFKIHVENPEIKNVLDNQMKFILEQMSKQGMQIEQFEVFVQDNPNNKEFTREFYLKQQRQLHKVYEIEKQNLNQVRENYYAFIPRFFGYNSLEIWA